MVKSLLLVWLIGVVAFFVLWALLAKVIRRISENRQPDNPITKEEDKIKSATED
jgi:flagellar biosynthesis/type III secretory pathway M-ring protein FliF/YscJ